MAFKGEIYGQNKTRISCSVNLKPWMTVKAINNIKMNRLFVTPTGVVRFLPCLIQMNWINVCLHASKRTDSKCLIVIGIYPLC